MALSDLARKVDILNNSLGMKRAESKGWEPRATAYVGYGSSGVLHVLGRVIMVDPQAETGRNWAERGYKQFFTVQVPNYPVTVRVGDIEVEGFSDDNGYVDVLVHDHGLEPGWHRVWIQAGQSKPVSADVVVIDDSARVGLISDIDDTTIITWLPRALRAAWNSWVVRTDTRQPVPGMARFYHELIDEHPGAPVFYLSTGAWNTFDTLRTFLKEHGFPEGPLLLTDWGPTPTGIFRNGPEHKKVQLRNLIIDFPQIRWILVGDDGQHDPLIYGGLVLDHPDRVAGVAIRNLSPQEHVLSHGTHQPLFDTQAGLRGEVPVIHGENGHELIAESAALKEELSRS